MAVSAQQPSNPLKPKPRRAIIHNIGIFFLRLSGVAAAGLLAVLMVVAVAMAMAFPNLPEVSALSDYRPKLPMRVFTAEGELVAGFGEERRELAPSYPR